VIKKSNDGSAKTNSHTRNTLLLMDINFFGVKDQTKVTPIVHDSRFNPTEVPNDPNEIPPYVFKLRDAFVIKTLDDDA
jgi:hypothetical protein